MTNAIADVQLVAADQTSVSLLGGAPYELASSMVGFGLPSSTPRVLTAPGLDGGVQRGRTRTDVRDVLLPIMVRTSDPWDCQQAIDRLYAMTNTDVTGPCTLRVIKYRDSFGSVADTYDLPILRTGDGRASDFTAALPERLIGLSFVAPDPWWLGSPQTFTYTNQAASAFFPIFPMSLSTASILGGSAFDQPGDTDAYPVWTLTGPFNSVTAGRQGQLWSFDATAGGGIAAGSVVVVDTNPRNNPRITLDGSSAWLYLTPASQLWSIPPGRQPFTVSSTGTSTNTTISVTFRPRYAAVM